MAPVVFKIIKKLSDKLSEEVSSSETVTEKMCPSFQEQTVKHCKA